MILFVIRLFKHMYCICYFDNFTRVLDKNKNIDVEFLRVFRVRSFVPASRSFDKNYGRHELGKNPAVPGWRVGVLIDKEATVL